jgi:hypothetical protein
MMGFAYRSRVKVKWRSIGCLSLHHHMGPGRKVIQRSGTNRKARTCMHFASFQFQMSLTGTGGCSTPARSARVASRTASPTPALRARRNVRGRTGGSRHMDTDQASKAGAGSRDGPAACWLLRATRAACLTLRAPHAVYPCLVTAPDVDGVSVYTKSI